MPKVKFHYADASFRYNRKTDLKLLVEAIFKKEKQKLNKLDYVFCSDEYLLQINQSHLNHDSYTDIITFDLSENRINGINGEVYVSIDRIKENASKFNTSFIEELQRVVFHGALHLCGYKDKKKTDIEIMRSKENHYLNQISLK